MKTSEQIPLASEADALPSLLDRFPKVRSFIAEREFLEGKAREGSWSGPMTAEQRCHREILSGI